MNYSDIPDCDQLKPKTKIFEPDTRFVGWGSAEGVGYIHDQLSPLLLNPKTPMDIRVEFESAKNVFLYAYCSYMLTNISAQVAIGVLEKFLKFHLEKNLSMKLKSNKLVFLLDHCVKENIITSDFFLYSVHSNKEAQCLAKKDQEKLKRYLDSLIRKKRNRLTHEVHQADIPWNNLDVLRDVAAIINFVGREVASELSLEYSE